MPHHTNLPASPGDPSEFLLYQTEDGRTRLEVPTTGDTVWLSLNQMARLFQRDKSTISRHIRNIFNEGELVRDSVVADFATTAADGKTYQVEHFDLDVIISVGYRRAAAPRSHRPRQAALRERRASRYGGQCRHAREWREEAESRLSGGSRRTE